MKKINLKGVTVQTWTRTVVLLIALVSQLLVVFGKKTETVDIDKATQIVTYLFTAIAAVWSWWKNNSFTKEAQEADRVKDGEITIPCGENETGVVIDENGNKI